MEKAKGVAAQVEADILLMKGLVDHLQSERAKVAI
jgi:hypothetical protein